MPNVLKEVKKINLERLWAPWRMQYIKTCDDISENCFLCEAVEAGVCIEKLVLYCDALMLAVLNKFPYNNGHLLVAPVRHISELDDLTDDELLSFGNTTRNAIKWLNKLYKPNGFNIGFNIGRVAGAGLPGHLHIHIVPRWDGDTNFMPIINNTKIISESLEESWKSLIEIINNQHYIEP